MNRDTPPHTLKSYSIWLKTVADDCSETTLGRGARLSILEPINPELGPRFGVVWDEDNDERVIHAAVVLLSSRLLSPGELFFIGERKGVLSLILRSPLSKEKSASVCALLEPAIDGDTFSVNISVWPQTDYIVQTDQSVSRAWLFGNALAWGILQKQLEQSVFPW